MSDLYGIQVEERVETDLEGALADAVVHGMSSAALRRILARTEGPCVISTLAVTRAHPDADRLDAPTTGLLHGVLADCSDALRDALGGHDVINNPKFIPLPGTSKVAYAVIDASPERLRLRLWSPIGLAPERDGAYSSAAWAVDRARLDQRKPWPDMRRFPPPGLAGELKLGRDGTAIAKSFWPLFDHKMFKKKGLEAVAAARIGASVYVLSDVGGHVLALDPPYKALRVVGRASPEHAKLRFTTLTARDGKLIAGDESGGWTEVDPESGARSAAAPAEPSADLCTAVHGDRRARIDTQGLLTVEGLGQPVELATSLRSPQALLATPDVDTWLVSIAQGSYLVHVPTQAIIHLGGAAKALFELPKPRTLLLICPQSAQLAKFER